MIAISAASGIGIGALREKLTEVVEKSLVERTVQVPMATYNLFGKVHEWADVLEKTFDDHFAYVRIRFSPKVQDHVERILAAAHAETV